MNIIEKIKSISKPIRKKFDDLPDMRIDGSIDKFVASDFAKDSIKILQEDAKKSGIDLEVKVVGVALRIVLLDPADLTRTHIATTEVAMTHPDLDLRELLSNSDILEDIDLDKIKHKHHDEEQPYAAGNYEGNMYG